MRETTDAWDSFSASYRTTPSSGQHLASKCAIPLGEQNYYGHIVLTGCSEKAENVHVRGESTIPFVQEIFTEDLLCTEDLELKDVASTIKGFVEGKRLESQGHMGALTGAVLWVP